MKVKYCCLIALAMVTSINGYTQIIPGIVTDKESNPIPYASIGLIGRDYGMIAGGDGRFSLDMKRMKYGDTLRISCIGYHHRDYTYQEIQNTGFMIGVLNKYIYPIEEVIISPASGGTVKFGKQKFHSSGWAFGGSLNDVAGYELARMFRNSEWIRLSKFQFHIKTSDFDSLLFRLNIYSEKDGMPDTIINRSAIYIKTTEKSGWIIKDLLDYNILPESNFFVSLECIYGWGSGLKTVSPSAHLILSGQQGKKHVTWNRPHRFKTWIRADILMDFFLLSEQVKTGYNR